MLVARSLDPQYLSNGYIVGDEPGGTAVFVDSGAPMEPLFAFAREHELTATHVLRTHSHGDHVVHEDELGLPVVLGSLKVGGSRDRGDPDARALRRHGLLRGQGRR